MKGTLTLRNLEDMYMYVLNMPIGFEDLLFSFVPTDPPPIRKAQIELQCSLSFSLRGSLRKEYVLKTYYGIPRQITHWQQKRIVWEKQNVLNEQKFLSIEGLPVLC